VADPAKITITFDEVEALLDPSMSYKPAMQGFLLAQLICSKFKKAGLEIEKPALGELVLVHPMMPTHMEVYWRPTTADKAVDLYDKKVHKTIAEFVQEGIKAHAAPPKVPHKIQAT
jgi:hypothetical protein